MTKITGHLLSIITISIWSSTFIVSKIVLQEFTPLQILFFRFAIAVVFLSILYPKFKKPESIKEELVFLLSGASLALYFFFENSALMNTYSSNVSLIVSTIPFMTAIFSALIYKTHFFNKRSILGLVIAYFGVIMIIVNGQKIAGIKPIGDLFALIASVLFAIYTLSMQKVHGEYHLIELTRKVMFYGLCVLSLIIFISGESLGVDHFGPKLFASMFFLGIVASSLAFLMWNKAIQIIGSLATNQYIYLVPVITTVFSALIIHEKITLITILGAALILLGLFVSENTQNSESSDVLPSEEKVIED